MKNNEINKQNDFRSFIMDCKKKRNPGEDLPLIALVYIPTFYEMREIHSFSWQ